MFKTHVFYRLLVMSFFISFMSLQNYATMSNDSVCGSVIVVMDEMDCMVFSPNPSTTGQLTLSTNSCILSIEIKDLQGNLVFYKTGCNIETIDLSGLAVGSYLIYSRATTCNAVNSMQISNN